MDQQKHDDVRKFKAALEKLKQEHREVRPNARSAGAHATRRPVVHMGGAAAPKKGKRSKGRRRGR